MHDKQRRILDCLGNLPRKMLSVNGHDNITEFVLHELCHKNCYDLNKAAYFVDNPDFNCCKGVAGFAQEEAYPHGGIWQEPDNFTQYMQSSSFNQAVRNLNCLPRPKNTLSGTDWAHQIASDLNLSDPKFCSWTMKHNNYGILVYEKSDEQDGVDQEQVINGLCFLGFCPIF